MKKKKKKKRVSCRPLNITSTWKRMYKSHATSTRTRSQKEEEQNIWMNKKNIYATVNKNKKIRRFSNNIIIIIISAVLIINHESFCKSILYDTTFIFLSIYNALKSKYYYLFTSYDHMLWPFHPKFGIYRGPSWTRYR